MSMNAKQNDIAAHGWEVRPLDEVVKPTRPRIKPSEKSDLPFIGMEHVEAHTMKLLGTVPAGTMKSSAVHFRAGDVLYGRLRPYLNKVYRPDFEGLCSAEFIVFPKTEGVDSRYLQHFLNSSAFVSFASHLNTGDRPRVDFDQLAPYEFPLAPLDQQKRIVAEIEKQFSRLDEAVTNLKRVKANLKRYKAAVLKAAIEGRLVETEAELARREGRSYETGEQLLKRILETRRSQWQGKGKYKEPPAPDTTELPELPEGWVHSSLDALLREPLRNGHSAKGTNNLSGLRAFTLSAVTEGDFSEVNTKRTVADVAKVADLWAQPGDIYVERSNTPELVGTARLYNGPSNFAFIPDLLIRVRVCQSVLPRYVEVALQSDEGRQYFKGRAQGISGTMPKIDQAAIEAFAIPLPPVPEQHRIVAEVDRRRSLLRETEAQVDTNLQRAQALRQAILGKAFTPAE